MFVSSKLFLLPVCALLLVETQSFVSTNLDPRFNQHQWNKHVTKSSLVMVSNSKRKQDITSSSSKSSLLQLPGAKLIQKANNGPYVPTGLSQEEYDAIKLQERQELEQMNFGTWGPRFQPTDAPLGDWFVIPTLWTNGIDVRARPQLSTQSIDDKKRLSRLVRRGYSNLSRFIKIYGPSFLMAYIMIDMIITALTISQTPKTITLKHALWIVQKLAWLRRLPYLTSTSVLWKVQGMKVLLASIVTPLTNNYLEYVNRRLLWSKRRIIGTTATIGMGFLLLWATTIKFTPMLTRAILMMLS